MLKNNSLLKNAGYINGQWIGADSDNRFDVKNAYSQELISTLPQMGKEETNSAIEAANNAWPNWRNKTAKERAA
nr:aldehyde dehydrogenase family protein [Gammaproteobacteria bacterium]